jgi:CubicO group peptidase (beta-lactamase class C family)
MFASRLHQRVRIVFTHIILGVGADFSFCEPGQVPPPKLAFVASKANSEALRQERQQFQLQELITATPNMWIFSPGQTPRIVWRDGNEVRRLGVTDPLRIRWFNPRLEEAPIPNESGRWTAWIDGIAPNGLPFRRTLTFFARPANFLLYFAPNLKVPLPYMPGAASEVVWQEHQMELDQLSSTLLLRGINDSEAGAIMLAGLFESKPLGRPARSVDSTAVRNHDYQLALKLKVEGLQDRVRTLRLPRLLSKPGIAIHTGPPEEAGVESAAKERIDAVCDAWANDTGEPFVVLVAKNGVIITHEAFGRDSAGRPISIDYRCWVGSITKSVTALLFSQFVDQKLIDLGDSLATVLPDYPRKDSHVPTFRQCFNHTSGLNGHGDFGGANNPHLENVILNAIDVNEPGIRYSYSGMGYDLAAKAMEIVSGKSFVRLYDEHLFRPLHFGDVPIGNASSEGHFTAMELGILAQLIANRGSYGELQFISPQTFDRLLPEKLHVTDHAGVEDEGIGLHWIRRLRTAAAPNSNRAEDQILSMHTVGHGSLSGCMFVIDLDQQLIIAQVRRQTGSRYAEWSAKFYQAIADAMTNDNAAVVGLAEGPN